MGDIRNAGGLLVNQYEYNWPPFGNGKGLSKGSYADGIKTFKEFLPNRLEEAWISSMKNLSVLIMPVALLL
jgi:7,8-dihydropterin-6-yl-methyl-4-(beta-D-ribofuranosyl)aminobenzene 5'-phosphate synthase